MEWDQWGALGGLIVSLAVLALVILEWWRDRTGDDEEFSE